MASNANNMSCGGWRGSSVWLAWPAWLTGVTRPAVWQCETLSKLSQSINGSMSANGESLKTSQLFVSLNGHRKLMAAAYGSEGGIAPGSM